MTAATTIRREPTIEDFNRFSAVVQFILGYQAWEQARATRVIADLRRQCDTDTAQLCLGSLKALRTIKFHSQCASISRQISDKVEHAKLGIQAIEQYKVAPHPTLLDALEHQISYLKRDYVL